MILKDISFEWFNIANYAHESRLLSIIHYGRLLEARADIKTLNPEIYSDRYHMDALFREIFIKENPYLLWRDDPYRYQVVPRLNPQAIQPLSEIDFENLTWQLSPKYIKNHKKLLGDPLAHTFIVDINEPYQNDNPSKNIYLKVNLKASKAKLLEEFEKFIDQNQKKYDCVSPYKIKSEKSPEKLLETFLNFNVLAYIDLCLFGEHNNIEISDAQIGRLIYGESFNSSLDSKKISRLKEYAERALDEKTYSQFMS